MNEIKLELYKNLSISSKIILPFYFLFFSLLFLLQSGCESAKSTKIETADVEIKPVEIISGNGTRQNNIRQYGVNYSELIDGEKLDILFFAVSVYQPQGTRYTYDTVEVIDITILNSVKGIEDCQIDAIDMDRRISKQIRIDYNSSKKPSEIIINGKPYRPLEDLKFNVSSHITDKQLQSIYKPIKLVGLAEKSHQVGKIVQPRQMQMVVGCVIYKCNTEVDWDAFFNSGRFKEFVCSSVSIPVSDNFLQRLNSLSIYDYD